MYYDYLKSSRLEKLLLREYIMKRRIITGIILLSLCCGLLSGTAGASTTSKPSSWAVGEVNEAIDLRIVPTSLRSKYTTDITRSEYCELMMLMLSRKLGKTIEEIVKAKQGVAVAFSDTTNESVLAASALGIVNGVGAGMFDPGRAITRQEAAVLMVRTAAVIGAVPAATETLTYKDEKNIGTWARDGVATVLLLKDLKNGAAVMGGTGNNMFSPASGFSREMGIIAAKRLFNSFPDIVQSKAFAFPYKFSAQDIYGNDVTEATLGNKEVFFVHYWGTWCGPCVNEMPVMADLIKKYSGRVGFIGLLEDYSYYGGKDAAINIRNQSGADFLNIDASCSDVAALLSMVQASNAVPTTVLIDRNGKMIGQLIVGAYGENYASFIDDALGR